MFQSIVVAVHIGLLVTLAELRACGAGATFCKSNLDIKSTVLEFSPHADAAEWLAALDVDNLKREFHENGVLAVPGLVDALNVPVYADLYRRIIKGEINASAHRHDLGKHLGGDKENVPQIMWPRLYFNWQQGPLHSRAEALAQALLGPDMVFDFDMLIYKGPGQDNPFPWHQDAGYWKSGMNGFEFPDTRSTSIWIALDDADEQNGCMWMVPGSHKENVVFDHVPVKQGHHTIHTGGKVDARAQALIDAGQRSYPIVAGGAVLNTGLTLHFTGGNLSPDRPRRAYIANFRPAPMVELERNHGFDHGLHGIHGAGFGHPKVA
jgi:ectoine hydroxylase-related dioxygenase (phytanoyl-CoA dioxygenase family)